MRPLTGAPQGRLDWARDGRDWPNHAASRFVESAGLHWHVQVFEPQVGGASAPVVLLLHGTGAASHSWRDLAPLLSQSCRVLAPDLPGHGFTSMPAPHALSLPGMARAVSGLLRTLDVTPQIIVGHSAGAAIGAWMCLEDLCAPNTLVGLNGAWLPFDGLASQWFSPAAKLLARSGLAARLFSRLGAEPAVVDRLLAGTGSQIDPAGRRAYARLVAHPGHVSAALAMMAHWDLRELAAALPRLRPRLLLIAGERDLTVPARQSRQVHRQVAGSALQLLPDLGHLAHEERPDLVAALIMAQAGKPDGSAGPDSAMSIRAAPGP